MHKSVSELLDEIEHEGQDGRDPRVGPSDYGKCERQVAYRVRGHEQHEQVESSRAATIGTLIHMGIAAHVARRHHTYARVELHVDVPGLDRSGSADLLWVGSQRLVDVKTVSGRAFDRVCTFGAKTENIGQVETYALGLNRAGINVETLVLAYVNRENGDVWEHEWEYDEESARAVVSELVQLEQMIDAGFDMPRAENARLGAFPCDWCPFWRECWDVENTPEDRSHASKYTIDDEQIEDAIERYFEGMTLESKGKEIKSAAREQLVGITYENDAYRLAWSGGRTSYVDEIDHEQLVVLAVEAGLEVPMKSVEKRSARRIGLKRVKTS